MVLINVSYNIAKVDIKIIIKINKLGSLIQWSTQKSKLNPRKQEG